MIEKWHVGWNWLLSVLLLTAMPLYAYNESGRLFRVFDSTDGLADNGAQVIICTKTGRMVICSIGHINFYNGSSFEHIDPMSQDVYELPKYQGHYHLYFDKQHHLWVKDKYQVTCVNLLTEQFVHDVKGVLKDLGFTGKAEDLFVDNDGCVLILSGDKLYNCKTKKSYPIRKGKSLQDVGTSEDKLMLLFYDDSSVEAFDHETGSLIYIKTAFNAVKAAKYNKSSVLLPDARGFYQIRNGEKESVLMHINAQSGEANIIMELPYHLNNMAIQDTLLYVAAQFGYWTFNVKTGEKNHNPKLTRIDYQQIDTDVNTIAFDLQGGMWIGTEKRGLLYSKPYLSPFKVYYWNDSKAKVYGDMLWRYSLAHQESLPRRINCMYHDSRGWKWEGSYTGLRLFQNKKSEPIIYNANDGLDNDVIHSIIEDDDHNIWVGTSSGISVLMIENKHVEKIVSFGEDDNIPKGTFTNGLAMKLDDGTIIMQSQDYVIEFNPTNFHTTKKIDIKLYPKLIRLTVNGRNVQPGMDFDGKMILDRAITRAREINLDYDQNTIELLFTGLNYFRPVQTYYRVRVKGFSNEWQIFAKNDESARVDSKGMLHYPIIGISPGKYEVEVQSSMSPDEWPVEPFVWIITVKEPWWRMTIVYAILGVLVLALLIGNFVFYNRNTRLKFDRNNIVGGVLNRVKAFSDICANMENETMAPVFSELIIEQDDENLDFFANVMLKLMPYIQSQQSQQLSLIKMSEIAEIEVNQLFDMISHNLYKSPRLVALKLRLKHVAELLTNSDKSVDEIAEDLNFVSSNFMIASFYHQYRMTPEAYRASNPR